MLLLGPLQTAEYEPHLRHARWLTFRRTHLSWSHDEGVPGLGWIYGALGRESVRTHAEEMVRPARLERATSWFVARRSIQLSYGRAGPCLWLRSGDTETRIVSHGR